MSVRRLLLVVGTALAFGLVAAAPAAAHPLGNFTANASAQLVVGAESTRIDYVLDLAEIPALQVRQGVDADGDGEVDGAEAGGYRAATCADIAAEQHLTVDGAAVPVRATASSLSFPQGQAGLETLRLECTLVAETGPLGRARLEYTDGRDLGRVGWREVVAVGVGTTLTASDVPGKSPSARLTAYPPDQLASPLDVTSADLTVDPSAGPAGPPAPAGQQLAPNGGTGRLERLTTAFTDLIARQDLTVGFGALAFGLAILLGTAHALAPGHGKTVMAAYLVGRQGTARQAVTLGGTVAATHTLGVLLLGAVLTLTQTLAPERLYPYLGLASGVVFAAVGAGLLRSALAGRNHPHAHGPCHDHGHDHPHAQPEGHGKSALGWRSLVAPGVAGGMVPSPSALVVLLGGIALGRAWFGVLLVLGYGLGMATTLVGAGYLLLRARTGLAARLDGRASGRWQRLAAALPALTSGLIVLGGCAIAVRSVLAI